MLTLFWARMLTTSCNPPGWSSISMASTSVRETVKPSFLSTSSASSGLSTMNFMIPNPFVLVIDMSRILIFESERTLVTLSILPSLFSANIEICITLSIAAPLKKEFLQGPVIYDSLCLTLADRQGARLQKLHFRFHQDCRPYPVRYHRFQFHKVSYIAVKQVF